MSTAETGGLMTSNRRTRCRVQQWSTGAGLLAAAAMIGMATAHADTDDPAVVPYSPDPSNVFSPVYTITPTGAEDVSVTDGAGDVYGTQDFTISELGFPVDTFTGNVEYTPTLFDGATGLSGILSQLSQDFGLSGGYSEEITTLGGTGTVLPDEPTGFLIDEFGLGYGNVFEESMNSAGTSATVGDFILTPFGDENITPIVDLFLPQGVGITDAAGAVDPSSFADLLSSIGL
jgi:hypothetical protein